MATKYTIKLRFFFSFCFDRIADNVTVISFTFCQNCSQHLKKKSFQLIVTEFVSLEQKVVISLNLSLHTFFLLLQKFNIKKIVRGNFGTFPRCAPTWQNLADIPNIQSLKGKDYSPTDFFLFILHLHNFHCT